MSWNIFFVGYVMEHILCYPFFALWAQNKNDLAGKLLNFRLETFSFWMFCKKLCLINTSISRRKLLGYQRRTCTTASLSKKQIDFFIWAFNCFDYHWAKQFKIKMSQRVGKMLTKYKNKSKTRKFRSRWKKTEKNIHFPNTVVTQIKWNWKKIHQIIML